MVNFFVNKLNRLIFHKISPDERLLDAFFYQEARPWGNLRPGFSFPFPDRQRPQDVVFSILEITTGRCRDWGRDVPVIDRNTAVFTFVVAGAVVIGITASTFPAGSCCASPAGGAVSMVLAAISERSAEVAHLLWEQGGAGSSPAAPTTIFPPGHSVLSPVASQAVIRPDRLDLGP